MNLESFRKGLIDWNAAPLCVVGFFCFIAWKITERLLDPSCETDVAFAGILSAALAGILLYISQMYHSMQKDRKNET